MDFETFPYADEMAALADRCMAAGQAEGVIPADRSALHDRHRVVVARWAAHDGYIIGAVAVIQQPEDADYLWLDILYVMPEFRRRGIGRQLIGEVRRIAMAEGFGLLGLGTTSANVAMLSLVRETNFGGGSHYFYEDIPGGVA